MDNRSLSHTKWKCQYHIVFIPKYRKKILYGRVRNDVKEIISTLCKYKDVDIIVGKRQTMRLTLNETPLFYERRGFLHSSGSSDDQGIRSSNSAGSIFPCLSQRFGSSVRIYLK